MSLPAVTNSQRRYCTVCIALYLSALYCIVWTMDWIFTDQVRGQGEEQRHCDVPLARGD